jgi:predicted permease
MALSKLKALWRNVWRRQSVEADLDAEISGYRQMLEDEKIRAGVDPAVARREALMELEGATQVKESVRDARTGAGMDAIVAELRQSMRGLRRNPALTILGALMLALGMGSSTVVFSVFHAALLRPLPFRDAARLVELSETRLQRGIDQASFTEANFWDVRSQSRCFEEVASYHSNEANLTGAGEPQKVTATLVTAGFFRTLGVSPVIGRDFSYEDDRKGFINDVVIVGNKFWRNRFGGDASVLGKTLRLDNHVYTVVGVLPPGEPWIDDELYIPFGYRADANRGSWEFSAIARLRPGVSVDAAQADLQRVATGLAQAYPGDDKGIGFRIIPSRAWVASDTTRRALWVLLGAVGFLLLIACLNIANLLFARGTARQREIAVRMALGASRARLVRFVMLESSLLSTFGALLGLGLAYGAIRVIRAAEIRAVPRLADAGVNPWVLGFAALTAILTGVLSGIVPALQAPAGAIAATLREGERQAGNRRQGRLRGVLVTGEVAISFLLLVGAGLLIRSFMQLTSVNLGFQTEHRLMFSVNMPESYYEKGVGKQFMDRLFERLAADPEVLAVGAVSHRPVEGSNPGMGIDAAAGPQRRAPWASWRVITPGYFGAVGLPLQRGRVFDNSDKPVWTPPGSNLPRRVVISERLAKRIYPNEDAVGRHVTLWKGQSNLDAEVIGVVGDTRERGPAAGAALTVYIASGSNALPNEFVLHTRGNPVASAPTVRSIIASLDPNLPMSDVRSFDEVVHRSVAPQRFNVILLSVFSGLALLLATLGIYGVLSYTISRRTPEIALRVALGASAGSILRMTVGQGMRPALVGIVLGAGGAWWLSRYMATLLFGVKPFDFLTYAAVAAVLLVTALAACYWPGRRATRTDAAVALRAE